jgi:hypothetical protein
MRQFNNQRCKHFSFASDVDKPQIPFLGVLWKRVSNFAFVYSFFYTGFVQAYGHASRKCGAHIAFNKLYRFHEFRLLSGELYLTSLHIGLNLFRDRNELWFME